ncbi:MAG: peptide deformylase [Oscillospiraceae bacterium]|nr:peptide deformylase [Oscillospiraceae bacterium]
MAIREILTQGDASLLKPSRPVEQFDDRLYQLLDDMRDTLIEANGAGLAAVQVGVLRRVALIDTEETGLIELINPEIVAQSGEQEGAEGCLSVPGLYGIVKRPMKVKVKAQDRHGKEFKKFVEGLAARAVCHELEHLDGQLFTAKVSRYLTDEELSK